MTPSIVVDMDQNVQRHFFENYIKHYTGNRNSHKMLKSAIIRDVTSCSPVKFINVLEERTSSIFRVEERTK
jgi:hypothetical protein